jgi:hypothetical protein
MRPNQIPDEPLGRRHAMRQNRMPRQNVNQAARLGEVPHQNNARAHQVHGAPRVRFGNDDISPSQMYSGHLTGLLSFFNLCPRAPRVN